MSASEANNARRAAYGRGWYDALKHIKEQQLNNSRMDELERGLTGIAKKVLACIPLADDWNIAQIIAELARQGSVQELRVVQGCITNLREQGLVREPKAGRFIRVARKAGAKPLGEAPQDDRSFAEQAAEAVAGMAKGVEILAASAPTIRSAGQDADALTKLARLAELSSIVRNLSKSLLTVADGIDDMTLEIELRIQAVDSQAEKLKQLGALLRSIGVGELS